MASPNTAPAPQPPEDPRIAEARQLQDQIAQADAALAQIGTEQASTQAARDTAERQAEREMDTLLGQQVAIGRQNIAAAAVGANLLGYPSVPGIPTTTGRRATDNRQMADLPGGATGTPITAADITDGTYPLNPVFPKTARVGGRDAAIAAQNYNRHEPLTDHTLVSRIRRAATRATGHLLRFNGGVHPLVANTAYANPNRHGHTHLGNTTDPHNQPHVHGASTALLSRPEAMAYGAGTMMAHDDFISGQIGEREYHRTVADATINPQSLRAVAVAEDSRRRLTTELNDIDRALAATTNPAHQHALQASRDQVQRDLADPRVQFYIGDADAAAVEASTHPHHLLEIDARLRAEAAGLGGQARSNSNQPGTWEHGSATDMSDMIVRTPEAEGREAGRQTELQEVTQELSQLQRLPAMDAYGMPEYVGFTETMGRLRARRRELTEDLAQAANPADRSRIRADIDTVNDTIERMQTPPDALRRDRHALTVLQALYPDAWHRPPRNADDPIDPAGRAYLELIRDMAELDGRRYQLEAMLGYRELRTDLTRTPDGQTSSEYRAVAEAASDANNRLLGVIAMSSAIDAALPRESLDAHRYQLLAEARQLAAETPIVGTDSGRQINGAAQVFEDTLAAWEAAEERFARDPVTIQHPDRKPTQDVKNLRIRMDQLCRTLGFRRGHEREDFTAFAAGLPVPVDPANPARGFKSPPVTAQAMAFQTRIRDNRARRDELVEQERPLHQRVLAHITDDQPLLPLQQRYFGSRMLEVAPGRRARNAIMETNQRYTEQQTAHQAAVDRLTQLAADRTRTETERSRAAAQLAAVQASLRTSPPTPPPTTP